MIYDVGTTITSEAWDNKYKPNQDWNHAWGAAPANVIPRCLMGVQPVEPGFAKVQIRPQPGHLTSAGLDLPTIRGTIHADFSAEPNRPFILNVVLPANVKAVVYIPRPETGGTDVLMDGRVVQGTPVGRFLVLDDVTSGKYRFERNP